MEKYTVIYSNFFTRGSHTMSTVKHCRIQCEGNPWDSLEQYGIEASATNQILHGWPKFYGQEDEPVEEPKLKREGD